MTRIISLSVTMFFASIILLISAIIHPLTTELTWNFGGQGVTDDPLISYNQAWWALQNAKIRYVDNTEWGKEFSEMYLYGVFIFSPDEVYIYYYRSTTRCYAIWRHTNRHLRRSVYSRYMVDCQMFNSLIVPVLYPASGIYYNGL